MHRSWFAAVTVAAVIALTSCQNSNPTLTNHFGDCTFAPHAVCRNQNLGALNLESMDLTGMDLSGSDLTDSDLHGAILRNATLVGTNLSAVNLSGADLRGANLTPASTAPIGPGRIEPESDTARRCFLIPRSRTARSSLSRVMSVRWIHRRS